MVTLLVLFPICALVQAVARNGARGLDHLFWFNLGFLVYVSVPSLSLYYPPNGSDILITLWANIASLLDEKARMSMMVYFGGIWTSFHLGHLLVRSSGWRTTANSEGSNFLQPQMYPVNSAEISQGLRIVLPSVAGALILFSTAMSVLHADSFFVSYGGESYDVSFRGPLQQAIYVLTIVIIMAYLFAVGGPSIKIFLWGAFAFVSLTSLALGTRQGVLLSLVALITLTCRTAAWLRIWHIVLISFLTVSLAAVVGVLREGATEFSHAFIYMAVENHATFISAITVFAFNDLAAFNYPGPLLAEFINLVPTALWPGKLEYLREVADNYVFFAPLGARHLSSSLLDNFGYIGSFLALLFAGASLAWLQRCAGTPVPATIYIWCSSVLASDIWRNGFSVSIVKSTVQSGILTPIIICLLAVVVALLSRPTSKFGRQGT